MPLVLDASVTMAWCFADETTPYARKVLAGLGDDIAVVTAIWPLEIANAIRMAERRGRLQEADAIRFRTLLGDLSIRVRSMDLDRALGDVLRLAQKHNLTSYDASYLELAIREGLPLATADGRLAAAARAAGVPVVQ